MLIPFLTVSGAVFWMILAGILVLDVILLSVGSDPEDENTGWAIFLTVGGLLAVVLFTDALVGMKLAYLVTGLLAYVAVGVIWSFKKWYGFVIGKLRELRDVFDRNRPKDRTFEDYAKDKRPLAANNKQRIVGWMALWPFSMSWWVLTWPRHAFVWAYNRLATVFDRISAKIWASAT
jgi:hypothetical protein